MKVQAAMILVLGVSLVVAPSVVDAQELLKDPITPFKQGLLQQLRDKRFAELEQIENDGQQGFAIYHHIIVRISHSHTRTEMFRDNTLHWRRIQWSFADRERLYGESREAVNAMCWLAAAAGDKAAAISWPASASRGIRQPGIRVRTSTNSKEWLKTDEQ